MDIHSSFHSALAQCDTERVSVSAVVKIRCRMKKCVVTNSSEPSHPEKVPNY